MSELITVHHGGGSINFPIDETPATNHVPPASRVATLLSASRCLQRLHENAIPRAISLVSVIASCQLNLFFLLAAPRGHDSHSVLGGASLIRSYAVRTPSSVIGKSRECGCGRLTRTRASPPRTHPRRSHFSPGSRAECNTSPAPSDHD